MLEVQFFEHHLDVIGIQEGRSPHTEQTEGQHYAMYAAAAAADGSLGVQAWVKHGVPVLSWHVTSTRVMYVIAGRAGYEVGYLVAHAPHSMMPEALRLTWWADLTALLVQLVARFRIPWVLLIDANGRVGSAASPVIGPSNPELENPNGCSLRTLAEQIGLMLNNTWGPGGHTWTSTFGTQHRIDYIASSSVLSQRMVWCLPLPEIDLTLNSKKDHLVVAMETFVTPSLTTALCRDRPFRVNKYNLADPAKRDLFQQYLWQFPDVPPTVHIDDHLELLNIWTRWAAKMTFGEPERQPRQKWLSPDVWSIVQWIAPLRRARYAATEIRRQAALPFYLAAWRFALAQSTGAHQYLRQGEAIDAGPHLGAFFVNESRYAATISNIQKAIRPMLDADRKRHLDTMAAQAAQALHDHNSRQAYAVIRALSGRAARPPQNVRKADGSLTQIPQEVMEAWQGHNATVYRGDIVTRDTLRLPPNEPCDVLSSLDVGPVATERVYAALGRNKGTGYDGIPAELLVAGGSALACKYSAVNLRVKANSSWPSQWRGGRSQNVWKKKADPEIMDNHRTLLLADHASKGLTGMIKAALDEPYITHQPDCQYGARPGRGTDMASHLIQSLINYAALASWSLLVLFVDLTKAFDLVVRQLLYGWGEVPEHHRKCHLLDLGLTERAADWIVQYIQARGPLLKQWHADAAASAMAQTLHEGAWVAVGDLHTAVTSKTGGRQGCKLGALTFNSIYGIALDMIAWELERHGVVLRLARAPDAFWGEPMQGAAATQPTLDAAFIDDEALVVMAPLAKDLDASIDVLLETVLEVFDCLHLTLNAEPGKSEALLQYRGPEAVARREARRCADGRLRLRVPHRRIQIDVVESYKHLGTFTSLRDLSMANARHRTSSTMKAYAPLSWKVFGSAWIEQSYKLLFANTLLFSRLFFGIHVLVLSPRQLKHLNGTYMVILRRIADEPRFCQTEHTDRQIREKLQHPAIECILAKMRLAYCARLLRVCPAALLAVLHARPGGKSLRWMKQLKNDTELLRPLLPEGFPTLDADPQAWRDLMLREQEWCGLVSRICFYASCCDAEAAPPGEHARAFECNCGQAFPTQRALESHQRAKHGTRLEIQDYLPSATCPCCGKNFHERVRLIAHVSDRRRPKCRDWILVHVPRLSQAKARELRLKDRELRRAAQQSGHSHHLASRPPR